MNNFLLTIGFFLSLILAVLFAGPHFVDWNQYRHSFETQASKVVGREVRVGGKVSLRLLPTPYLRFENVRIGDQEGRFAEPFLKMNSFTMLLSVPPLLKGDVEASGIELESPSFHLVLDDEKGPNWKGLGAGQLTLPVAPKSIAFKSIRVTDGHFVLKVSGNKKILEYDRIEVELSAAAITGPFKLNGSYYAGDSLRKVSLATGALEADGSVPLKSRISNPENGMSYSFDGDLRNGGSDPVFEGKLRAIFPVSGPGLAAAPGNSAAPGLASTAELDATIKGDVRTFKLDDLTIAFESEGRPQSLRGQAELDWQDGLALKSELHAIWLDLDRIAGYGGKKALPWVVLRSLVEGGEGNWPSADKVDVRIAVDQATLGGDAINSVVAQLYKSESELRLKTFTAALPGTSHIRMSGQIVEGENPAFIGDVTLRGRSFARFRRWAMHDFLETAKGDDGYFALRGLVDASGDGLALSQLRGEYAKTVFRGRASTNFGDNREFDIFIDSDKIDLRQSLDQKVTISTLADLVAGYSAALSRPSDADKGKTGVADLRNFKNGRLAFKVGQLLLPNENFRDVNADIAIKPHRVDIAHGRFETFSGARFEIDGNVDSRKDVPAGRLNVLLEAPRLQAVKSVAGFLDLPGGSIDIDKFSPELAPIRLAGVIKLGTRDGRSTEASLDGSMGRTRATLLLRLDGKPSLWRSGEVDIVSYLTSDDGATLLAQLFATTSDRFAQDGVQGTPMKGRLAMRMSGKPEKGMVSVVDLEAPGFRGGYRGTLGLPGDKIRLEGEVSLDAQNGKPLLSLVGLDRMAPAEQQQALRAKGLIFGESGVFQMSDFDFRLGGSRIRGEGSVEFGDNGAEVKLIARTGSFSLPTLLSSIVAKKSPEPVRPARGNRGRAQPAPVQDLFWTDRIFDFSMFESLSGSLELAAREIDIGQGLSLTSGRVMADFGRAGLRIENISGQLGGGKLSASLDMKRGAAGVSTSARAQLRGVDLRRFRRIDPKSAQPLYVSVAQGEFAMDLDVEGRGLSPRGVVSSLKGQGVAHFKDFALMHFSPEAVEVASNAMLQGNRRPNKKRLEAAIVDNLGKGVLKVGMRKVDLKVTDGTVSLARQTLKKPATELIVSTYVDINRMLIDSEWVINPKVKIKAALQPVTILYNGPVAELNTMRPVIDAEQLSRELVVRKLELDVEVLEALRKRDDELAREAAIALEQQKADWGMTEPVEGDEKDNPDDANNNATPGPQSSADPAEQRWQSSVTPFGPYGSAYEPLEKAVPDPPAQTGPARVRRKKVKKNTFEQIFNF